MKPVGKWLVTGEEGGLQQATCVWFHRPNFILANVTMDRLWRNAFGQMDRWTDRQTDRQTDRRTDEAATVCSPFGEHNNNMLDKMLHGDALTPIYQSLAMLCLLSVATPCYSP